MRTIKSVICSILLLTLLSCMNCLADDKLSVVCTSFPCYDFARAVAGEDADIRLLIKPGSEVHSYEPTPADVLAIADCDLFVYIGGESDSWVQVILESFGHEAPETLRFFDCVEAIEAGHEDEHDDHAYDEHIWTSPVNAMRMVEALSSKLCMIAPAYEVAFQQRANAYISMIREIDSSFQNIVESAQRKEIIFADRFPFQYFANEYGIEWRAAFESCSSESEPSAKDMMELIEYVVRAEVPVVYTIELSNGKTAKTIADETGVEICTFHSVQNVTEADFSAGESYVSLMLKNVIALEKGLN